MIEEADKYKAEDSKFLEKVKAMNALDDYVYKMWKALKDKDISSKLRQLDKEKISSAIANARNLLDADGNNQPQNVFEDYLKEVESIYGTIIFKIG